jgi:hypothetical protein
LQRLKLVVAASSEESAAASHELAAQAQTSMDAVRRLQAMLGVAQGEAIAGPHRSPVGVEAFAHGHRANVISLERPAPRRTATHASPAGSDRWRHNG